MGRLTPIVVKALISADCAGSSQKDPSKFLSFREEVLCAVDGNECGNTTIDVCACRQEALRYQIAVLPASHSIDTGFRPPDHSTKAELQSAVPAASPRLAYNIRFKDDHTNLGGLAGALPLTYIAHRSDDARHEVAQPQKSIERIRARPPVQRRKLEVWL